MGINYIPGPESYLAQPLAMFAEGLNNMINPNFKFQKAMQGLLAQKPELIQQLADVEATTPGTLEKLGFGGLTSTISQVPQSAQSKFQQKNRDKIVQTEEGKMEAEAVKAQFTIDDIKGYAEFIKQNPNAKFEDYMHRLTGETETTRLKRPAVAAESKVVADAIGQTPDLAAINLRDEARKFLRDPSYDAQRAASFFTNPSTRDAFVQQISQYREDHLNAYQTAALAERGTGKDNFLTQKAFQMYDQSNAGTLDAWKDYLTNPETKRKAAELASKQRDTLAPSERDLVDVFEADKRMELSSRLRDTREYRVGIQNSVRNIRTAMDKGDQSGIDLELTSLNDLLTERGLHTGQKVTAKFGKIPGSGWLFENQGLYFVDENQQVVPEGQLYAGTLTGASGKQPTQKEINSKVLEGYARYLAVRPSERQRFLDELKLKNIQLHTELLAHIQQQTRTK